MQLIGNPAHWQQGKYFESWLSFITNCPNCKKELFNSKSKYREINKIVQCSCGARVEYDHKLQNSVIKHLITKHNFTIIKEDIKMSEETKAKKVSTTPVADANKSKIEVAEARIKVLNKNIKTRVALLDALEEGTTFDGEATERRLLKEEKTEVITKSKSVFDMKIENIKEYYKVEDKTIDTKIEEAKEKLKSLNAKKKDIASQDSLALLVGQKSLFNPFNE